MPYRDDTSDIYATEEDAPSSPAQASTSTNRNPLKRRANGPVHPAPRPKRQGTVESNSPSPAAAGIDLVIKSIDGACPPLNAQSALADDPANHRFFIFGGLRPDDTRHWPCSDLWVCHTESMTWSNLTDLLTFRDPKAGPFSSAELYPVRKRLPELKLPGCTLMRIEHGGQGAKTFILIIGGYDCALEKASARPVVVDPDEKRWWYLDIEGEPVHPRIDPAVATIGNNVYVFGGYTRFLKNQEPDSACKPHNSFSVLTFNSETPQVSFSWTIRDRPYNPAPTDDTPYNPAPTTVPPDLAFGAAIPVYEGKKILLLPGRHTSNKKPPPCISFTRKNIFTYHVRNMKFEDTGRNVMGSFPQNLGWHCSFEHARPADPVVNGGPNLISSSSLNPPSIIIGGWTSFRGSLVPELWHLLLTPEDRISCLKLAQHTWDLNHNFQWLVRAEGQVRLIGSEHNPPPSPQSQAQSRTQPQPLPYLDKYVDLPVSFEGV